MFEYGLDADGPFYTLELLQGSEQIAGTPSAIPPEALSGQALDQRTDLYARGALAYFLLTRQHAYAAHSVQARLNAIAGLAPDHDAQIASAYFRGVQLVERSRELARAERVITRAKQAHAAAGCSKRELRGQDAAARLWVLLTSLTEDRFAQAHRGWSQMYTRLQGLRTLPASVHETFLRTASFALGVLECQRDDERALDRLSKRALRQHP